MKRIIPYLIAAVLAAGCSKQDEAPAEEQATPTVVSVQTNALKLATLHHYIQGYGTVEAAPAASNAPAAGASVAAPVAGVVTKVAVVEGQQVAKGDLMVELNSGALTLENAEQEVARQRQLYAQQNTSLKNLQSAETQLALLRVAAPLSGTVTRVYVRPGQAVDSTTVIAEIMDFNRLAVAAQIPAAEASELKPGNLVQLEADPAVEAELSFVSPYVDTNNDTVLVRANIPAGSGLRTGQFVPLRIVTAVHTNCLAAPGESVITDDEGKSVLAIVTGDEAAQHEVKTGLREDDLVEIEGAGLKAGDIVVTVGAYGLPEKTKISVQSPAGEDAATNAAANSSNAK